MKKILFLVGPHASGKTYTSKEYTKEEKNTEMIDTGPIMRRIHNENSKETTIGEWVESLEKEYGKDITSHIISNEIKNTIENSDNENFILIGFRTIEGIQYTINNLDLEDYSIIYVDANEELLYSNYTSRENKKISFDEFKEYLNEELQDGLKKMKEIALQDPKMIEYYYKDANDDGLKKEIGKHFYNPDKKFTKTS